MSSLRLIPSPIGQQDVQPSTTGTSLASQFGINDSMRDGFNIGVKSKITQGHPLEQHYLDWEKQREELNYTIKRQTYGLHAPLRLKMEKALLSQPRGIPVVRSRNFGLDILQGKDLDIEFEDYLGDPNTASDFLDVHGCMERQLRMNV